MVETIVSIFRKIEKYMPIHVVTKLKNINKSMCDCILTSKRISQDSRILIPYTIITMNNLSIQNLDTYINGIVIDLPFQDYLHIQNKQYEELNEIEKYMLSNIGSNNNVSCILTITNSYSGGSYTLQQLLYIFKQHIQNNHWKPVKRNTDYTKDIYKGNEKWEGHYYYRICGGSNKIQEISHPNESDKDYQIFTTYKSFMNGNKYIYDVKASLYYQLLYFEDIEEYIHNNDDLQQFRSFLYSHLQNSVYLEKNVIDWFDYNKIFLVENNIVYSPTLIEPLRIDKIETIQISHNEAIVKQKIYYDTNMKTIVSDYRPGNLFWDYKLGNMQQQDFTIVEFWKSIEDRYNKRNLIYNSQISTSSNSQS